MTKEITVKVKHGHILDGEIESANCCAIALACEDVLLGTDIWDENDCFEMHVDSNAWINIRDKSQGETVYELEMNKEDKDICSRFIDRFDNQNEYYSSQEDKDQNLQPFEFKAKLVKVDND